MVELEILRKCQTGISLKRLIRCFRYEKIQIGWEYFDKIQVSQVYQFYQEQKD